MNIGPGGRLAYNFPPLADYRSLVDRKMLKKYPKNLISILYYKRTIIKAIYKIRLECTPENHFKIDCLCLKQRSTCSSRDDNKLIKNSNM